MDPLKINDLNDLQSLLEMMARFGLSELEIEGEGWKIRLRKPEPQAVVQAIPLAASMAQISGAPLSGAPQFQALSPAHAAGPASNLQDVTSPMVGTFYRALSPESDPFVLEGDRVEEKSVLCIIEAMKVMNEIHSGVSGVVKEILVKNGEPVEFGQPLFRIAPE